MSEFSKWMETQLWSECFVGAELEYYMEIAFDAGMKWVAKQQSESDLYKLNRNELELMLVNDEIKIKEILATLKDVHPHIDNELIRCDVGNLIIKIEGVKNER